MLVSSLCMVGYDGPAPGLEIWPAESRYCQRDVALASFNHSLKMATKADALGFDWVSVSEHHYAPYIMTPNPSVMAGALAQVTKRAKIALLGPLVPLSNPVRLAEELAMVDMLSGGRLIVLFLRGTPNEHRTYDNDPDATRAMTQEGIDLIVKAWTSDEPFAWEKEQYQCRRAPHGHRLLLRPARGRAGMGDALPRRGRQGRLAAGAATCHLSRYRLCSGKRRQSI